MFVRGKVLVWNIIENKEVTEIESLLPSELLAKSPNENITIFAIVQSFGNYGHQLVEIYWPEKEVVGIKNIYDLNNTGIAANTLTSNWINSLPKRDFIPAHTIIADVQSLVSEAKSSYQTPPNETTLALNGKVLVWNFYLGDREASDVEELLPSELLANSLNEKITLFAIVGEDVKTVGTYSNGGSAFQVYRDVLVVKWPEKEVIGRQTVEGERPPIIITVYGNSTAGATGNITAPTAEWILNLPR